MSKTTQRQGVLVIDPKAAELGIRISIHVTKGNFVACHELLDNYEKHYATGPPEIIECIAELQLDSRCINALDRAGYIFIHELTEKVLEQIKDMPSVGPRAETAIRASLEEYYETIGSDQAS